VGVVVVVVVVVVVWVLVGVGWFEVSGVCVLGGGEGGEGKGENNYLSHWSVVCVRDLHRVLHCPGQRPRVDHAGPCNISLID
jgi:hypothetical protein